MIKLSAKRDGWKKNRDGATAIEFSFLFVPYLLLSLGIIEMSMMFASESLLEGATTQAARSVKTGKLQQSGVGDMEGEFRASLCAAAPVLIRCEDIVIEARVMDSFSDFDGMQPTFDENGNMVSSGFDPGVSSGRVLIRASYNYQALTPLVGEMLWGPDRRRLFMSTVVMQIEPYDFAAELEAEGEI